MYKSILNKRCSIFNAEILLEKYCMNKLIFVTQILHIKNMWILKL